MAVNFDGEKAMLQKQGVYDHVGLIIKKVIEEKPHDPHKLLEVLSRAIKEPAKPAPVLDVAVLEKQAAYAVKVKEAGVVPVEESGEPAAVCAIPNFMEEATMLEWAGVGFGDVESYNIMMSLRALAAKKQGGGMSKLRLWGKIMGQESDYWVAEAQEDGGEGAGGDDAGEELAEPSGQGANTYKYYVTGDLFDEWVQLDDVRASEIVAARKIKRMLTGRLDAPVVAHPHFPGSEAKLLRAQIARIAADTLLCIKGYLKRDGEEEGEGGEIKPDEEWGQNCPPAAELCKLSMWTHMQAHILKSGRTTHPEVPDEGGEDEENDGVRAKLLAEIEADPGRDLLQPTDSDGLSWAVQQSGDLATYAGTSSAVTFVRSLTWPGAVCVAKGTNFVNLYVGNGLVAGEPDFFICAPPDVQEEPEDPGEQPEPQGSVPEPVEEEAAG